MLKRFTTMIGVCVGVVGCGGARTDRETYEALPAIAASSLPQSGVGLPDCLDEMPAQDDLVVRMAGPDKSQLVVVLREAQPLCVDEWSEWLGEDEGEPDPGTEEMSLEDPAEDDDPPPVPDPETEPSPEPDSDPEPTGSEKDQANGPRPIPWIHTDDDDND